MSVQALTWAISATAPNPSAKLVLICIANYADAKGRAHPGQKRLAEDSGLSLRTVNTALKALEDAGLIAREHRNRDDGYRTSDQYYLQISQVQELHEGDETNVQIMSTSHATVAQQYKPNGLSEPVREPSETRGRAFDDWYSLYPHKVGKQAARKAFDKAIKTASLDELTAGVHRYIAEKPPDRPWCNPATWLNQGRWEDNPATVQRKHTMLDTLKEMANEHNETGKPDGTVHRLSQH